MSIALSGLGRFRRFAATIALAAHATTASFSPRRDLCASIAGLSLLLLAAPARAQSAPVTVVVHEPLEVLCLTARFAGFDEYQPHRSKPKYGAAAEAHFAGAREHAVVQRLRALRKSHGISHDAVASLAVHLGSLPDLAPRTPLAPRPPMLDARWDGVDLEGFVGQLRDVAQQADAAAFFATQRDFHAEAARRLAARLGESQALPWFDAFFGKRAGASCTAVVGLLCGGQNYGVSVQHADGAPAELKPVFGCSRFDDTGLPTFGEEQRPLFVHELCHSYTNPIVDRHLARLQRAGDALFAAKEQAMREQAYTNARIVLYETFVRACVIRCLSDTEGAAAAKRQAAMEARDQFPWAAEIAALLGEYQSDRDKYPDFDAFVPRIAAALDAIAAKLPAADAAAPRLIAMAPANGSTDVDPATTELTFTFDQAMRDQSWSVVGSAQDTPKITGKPRYNANRKTLTLPVQLQPGRTYRFALNSAEKQGFVSEKGAPLVPTAITLKTRGG